jgi:hypothetical protein
MESVMVLRLLVCVGFFVLSVSGQSNDPLLDREMADKYDLDVPPLKTDLDPAPEWLQTAHMLVGSGARWIDHKFELKEVKTNRKASTKSNE